MKSVVKGGDNIAYGFYVAGKFVYASEEVYKDADGKEVKAGYLLVVIGGRKGAFNIKYDLSDADFAEFVDGLKGGDEILAGVRPSAFNGSVYYSLVSLQYLRMPDFASAPASAVDKMEARIKEAAS